ncbi:MAG: MFS transporter, partial [Armatimonadota bacterium]|nr:MFS transporter [Armatimonadota bacterium]
MAALPGDSRRSLVVAACLAMALFAASVVAPAIALIPFAEEFGLTYSQRGFLGAARMAALVAALLASGFLADRMGKRRFLVTGSLLVGAGMAATAAAWSHGALLAAQVLVGLGCGAYEAL